VKVNIKTSEIDAHKISKFSVIVNLFHWLEKTWRKYRYLLLLIRMVMWVTLFHFGLIQNKYVRLVRFAKKCGLICPSNMIFVVGLW